MKYKNILVTGGAGFVGSNICTRLKQKFPSIHIAAFDNLSRRGSELNVPRLKENKVVFLKGDVRNKTDLNLKNVDLIIECSADPSVMAGLNGSPEYVIDSNLVGGINCFELARRNKADVVFISTSRVYPMDLLNKINIKENETRFDIASTQKIPGVTKLGISELFPIEGVRSMYGATKLSAELILREYVAAYGINAVINRCGVIAGPWQMGKIDQGIIAFWIASHMFNRPLSYIGFGGEGKQVRDVLHVEDLFTLLISQISDMKKYSGTVYNVGGGIKNTVSLCELTAICRKLTGNKVRINSVPDNRKNDIPIYISDNTKITKVSGWKPKKAIEKIVDDTYHWLSENKYKLSFMYPA
jgi:CDP-paratose 2-epimerase